MSNRGNAIRSRSAEQSSTEEVVKSKVVERSKKTLFAVGKIAIPVLSMYLVFSDSNVDLLGDSSHKRTSQDIAQEVQQKSRKQFAEASPVGRYALSYLYQTYINVSTITEGNGILGVGVSANSHVIGNDCLESSPYNTFNQVRTSGAGVSYSSETPDDITILPSTAGAPVLKFAGVSSNDVLRPADKTTQDTLMAYGCPVTQEQ